jgi:hypothetical protein
VSYRNRRYRPLADSSASNHYLYIMSTNRSGGAPDDRDGGSWATETLPLSIRKEMLERELRKLGFRKADAGSGHASGSQQQQQPQGGSSSHPQADSTKSGDHSE